jgi:hypothetical protein
MRNFGELEGKTALWKPRRRREDNIRMDQKNGVKTCGLD